LAKSHIGPGNLARWLRIEATYPLIFRERDAPFVAVGVAGKGLP
jgi:hypothetical protein